MRYSSPHLRIYVPKNANNYLIQRFMEHPEYGYSQSTGEPLSYDRNSFVEKCAGIIEEILKDYPTQDDLGPPPETRMTAAEKKKFHSQYLTIVVDVVEDRQAEVCLIDMDESGDSGRGRDEQAVKLPVPFTSQQFIEALDAVVAQAKRS